MHNPNNGKGNYLELTAEAGKFGQREQGLREVLLEIFRMIFLAEKIYPVSKGTAFANMRFGQL